MSRPLLIEIGLEELPALPFLKELPHIKQKWVAILEKHSLATSCELYYTPRRLVLLHNDFPDKQPDLEEELFGPPLQIAYKDGVPTKAAEGFAKKAGMELKAIQTTQKGGKEVLYAKKNLPGKAVAELLGELILAFLSGLNFGKTMRWGMGDVEFIRPIRWLNVLHGADVCPVTVYGLQADRQSYPHRMHAFEPLVIETAETYLTQLESAGVVVSQAERREKILRDIDALEQQHNCRVDKDEELLQELVAITESPTSLIGRFDEAFLKLPPEVIITSMKEHQRYFAVTNQDGTMKNAFVVVSNALADDSSKIIAGNEKVLRARLSDALFFYENDLRNGFDTEALKGITFVKELGSMHDKIEREAMIACELGKRYHAPLREKEGMEEAAVIGLLERAAMLAKADLVSEMVYEFTELQGIMGGYYARAFEEPDCIVQAISEQYLPSGEDSAMPGSLFSALIALAHKLDNLLALFSIGMIPTGTKDPFALRRAATGVFRIVQQQELPFDLHEMLEALGARYGTGLDKTALESFMIERLQAVLGVNPSIIKAVIETGERDLLRISQKTGALQALTQQPEFSENFSTFKRVANITKEVDLGGDLDVDVALFEKAEEEMLWKAFDERKAGQGGYQEKLEALFGLKPELDAFFDSVMVNAEDAAIRTNRKHLVASIYREFYTIADIKEISV